MANPWCWLCERLVSVADADIACQEILQVFYQLEGYDDEAWTAQVTITIVCLRFMLTELLYILRGAFNRFRTVLLNKHTLTVENQNSYEGVWPLLYITYHGFIYDVTL